MTRDNRLTGMEPWQQGMSDEEWRAYTSESHRNGRRLMHALAEKERARPSGGLVLWAVILIAVAITFVGAVLAVAWLIIEVM